MKRAFTLVEILIVVAILSILAAIVLPTFQDHIQQARESAAKDNLRILRNAIGFYAAQHSDVPPGYFDNDPTGPAGPAKFWQQIVSVGNYLSDKPENPFNGKYRLKVINNAEDFPTEPVDTDLIGWVYKPAIKTIKLNWEGTDSTGKPYFDY